MNFAVTHVLRGDIIRQEVMVVTVAEVQVAGGDQVSWRKFSDTLACFIK
jgi:hypothetical protein